MQGSNGSLSSVKVWLDKTFLQTTKGAGEILTSLENANVTSIIEKLPVENSIFWTRTNTSTTTKNDLTSSETQHDHILVKVECDTFADYVSEHCESSDKRTSNLMKYVNCIKKNAQVSQITFLLPGFKQYFKYVVFRSRGRIVIHIRVNFRENSLNNNISYG